MSYSFPLRDMRIPSLLFLGAEVVLPPWAISGMADPLSIVAGIISVIGAVEGLRKTLEQIKNLSNAPDEVFALINEVSDFDIVLKRIEELVTDDDEAMAAHRYLGHIPRSTEKAQDQLLQLEHLIRGQLLKPKGPKRQPRCISHSMDDDQENDQQSADGPPKH